MRMNEKGKLFFIDHRAKRLTWEDPRLSTDPTLPQYKRDFKQKQIYFRSLDHLKAEAGKTAIPIARCKVLSDAFYQVMKKSPSQLKKKLVIKFDGEDGLDYGGLSREFFFLLSQSIFDPSYGLFQYCSPTNYLLQICPNSGVNPEHLHYFRFVGRVLGLAIFHSRFLDAFFTPSFYKALLKKKISLSDLQGVDRESFNSLTWILEHDLSAQGAHMEMYFVADDECMGTVETHELIPGGKQILVNDQNKHQYVDAYCKWKLYLRVKEQFDAIRHGLYEILPYETLVIFDEKEMELLLGGLKEIDTEDWQRHTEYKRYRATDKQIQWFWQVVQDYDAEKRMRLLQFVTGTSRLPIGGFRELHGSDGPRRFTVERTGSVDSLPKSHTCFNRLDLPAYSSYAQLHSKLTYAIEETVGFATE
jgi:E3 ubiquitin-protein ligase NEDD4